jgi:hypothetical protein
MNKPDWKYAPEWAYRLMQLNDDFYYWCDAKDYKLAEVNGICRKFGWTGSYNYCEFKLVETRPDPWAEGEERMENIVRNSGEGEHYDELPELDEFLGTEDNVNHPEHYQSDNGIECIDAIRAALGHDGFIAYCRGNAIKYNWRSGSKSSHSEDLKKGAWYSNRAAAELEKSK